MAKATDKPARNDLVPDPVIAGEFCISLMTLWRWTHERPDMNFPQPVKINGRNFRSRRQIERWKELAIRRATAEREVA